MRYSKKVWRPKTNATSEEDTGKIATQNTVQRQKQASEQRKQKEDKTGTDIVITANKFSVLESGLGKDPVEEEQTQKENYDDQTNEGIELAVILPLPQINQTMATTTELNNRDRKKSGKGPLSEASDNG